MINIELGTLIRSWIPPHQPGVAVALIKDGEVVHCQGGNAGMGTAYHTTYRLSFLLVHSR